MTELIANGHAASTSRPLRRVTGALLAAIAVPCVATSTTDGQTPPTLLGTPRPTISAVGQDSTHVCAVEAFANQDGQEVRVPTPYPCTSIYAPVGLSPRDAVQVTTPREAQAVTLTPNGDRARTQACSQTTPGDWTCSGRRLPLGERLALVAITYPVGRAIWSFDTAILPYGQRATDRKAGINFWLTGDRLRIQLQPRVNPRNVPRGRITATCTASQRSQAHARRRAITATLGLGGTIPYFWFAFRHPLPGPAKACVLEHSRSGREVAAVDFGRR